MRKSLSDFYQPIAQFASQFNSPKSEGLKSLLRMFSLMGIAWVIVQMLGQINLVPETQYLKIWVFEFSVPLRSLLWLVLTGVAKYVDKLLFEINHSVRKPKGDVSTGIIPF